MKMFVWRELPKLRDYSDGLLCVIAGSYIEAIGLAVDAVCGTHECTVMQRAAFHAEISAHSPEVIERGAVYIHGGS